jgi:hypothetical protein
MRPAIILCVFFCWFAFTSNAQHSGSHSSGSHSSKAAKSHASKSKSNGNKSVHVRGYYRKNGTYVAPYDRSASGTKGSSEGAANPSHEGSVAHGYTLPDATGSSTIDISKLPYRKGYAANGYSLHSSVQRDNHGKIRRSKAARSAFERQTPCPSTGKSHGACPGYVVDHVQALECGGADAPANMQWQTVADAKTKDKTERSCH